MTLFQGSREVSLSQGLNDNTVLSARSLLFKAKKLKGWCRFTPLSPDLITSVTLQCGDRLYTSDSDV